MDTTENLNIPYILPSQAQKHVTITRRSKRSAQLIRDR